jgi:hypothetical protein
VPVKTSPTESPFITENKLYAELGTLSKYPLIGQNKHTPRNVKAKNTGIAPSITLITNGIARANVLEIIV